MLTGSNAKSEHMAMKSFRTQFRNLNAFASIKSFVNIAVAKYHQGTCQCRELQNGKIHAPKEFKFP